MVKNQIKYISLREAARYCPYSPDYLKLRARQRKLKALKIGRNWVTTEKWIREYVEKFNGKVTLPPYNLPIVSELDVKKYLPKIEFPFFLPSFRIAFAFLIIFILIFSGINFQIGSFETEKLLMLDNIQKARELRIDIKEKGLASVTTVDWSDLKNLLNFLEDKKNKLVNYFSEKLNEFGGILALRAQKWGNIIIPEISKKGLVVIPFVKDGETAIEKIKKSFSDEVIVEPDESGISGVIKPVFRKDTDQKYLYLLVPLDRK